MNEFQVNYRLRGRFMRIRNYGKNRIDNSGKISCLGDKTKKNEKKSIEKLCYTYWEYNIVYKLFNLQGLGAEQTEYCVYLCG